MVEVRRIQNKLNVLNDKYNGLAKGYNQSDDAKIDIKPGTSRFHDSALAQWLGMLLYRADGKLDDARISRDDLAGAFREQPQLYPFAQPVLDGYLAPSDQPRLDVVAFVGRGPDKKANTLYIHTEDDLFVIGATEENPHNRQELTELDAFVWPGVKKGYHFKFQLPYMEKRGTGVSRVRLLVDGASVGDLSPIESLEDVAEDTWQIKQPIIYLKTIIRATAKGLLAEQGKRKMEDQRKTSCWALWPVWPPTPPWTPQRTPTCALPGSSRRARWWASSPCPQARTGSARSTSARAACCSSPTTSVRWTSGPAVSTCRKRSI
jgi:hypothetical protein